MKHIAGDFRVSREEIIGKKFIPLIPEEEQRLVREHFASLSTENPIATITHRIIMPDGALRWQWWSDRAIFNEQGILTEYQSVGRDITEKKEIEDALQDSKDRLNAIVDGSPIPQFVIDQDHRVIYWNSALERYSRIPAAEIIGTSRHWRAFYPSERPCLADLLVEKDLDHIPQWYEGKYKQSGLIEGGFEVTDFFPHLGHSGIWLYFTAAPIRNSQAKLSVQWKHWRMSPTGRRRKRRSGKRTRRLRNHLKR